MGWSFARQATASILKLAGIPASLFDNANDPYQYDKLAPAQPDHPFMAELARRDAVLPWRDLEDDPQ